VSATSPVPAFRCLIVEDHKFQRQVGAQVLRLCGATDVLEASDGAEALSVLASSPEPIEIVMCDLSMPGMDGLAFLRNIAEHNRATAVILASALYPSVIRAAETTAQSCGLSVLGAVEKPVTPAKIKPLLMRHFADGAQPRDQQR
jgi:CheY-like chemotaxis protein